MINTESDNDEEQTQNAHGGGDCLHVLDYDRRAGRGGAHFAERLRKQE
jgi:hypothetical protein